MGTNGDEDGEIIQSLRCKGYIVTRPREVTLAEAQRAADADAEVMVMAEKLRELGPELMLLQNKGLGRTTLFGVLASAFGDMAAKIARGEKDLPTWEMIKILWVLWRKDGGR